MPSNLMLLSISSFRTSLTTEVSAGKRFFSGMPTSDVTLHPRIVNKTLSTVFAGVQLVLVLCVHNLHVPPKVGVASHTVRALLFTPIDMSSSPVHHHPQSSLELETARLTSDHLSVVLVSFVIVKQNLVLGCEPTRVTNTK